MVDGSLVECKATSFLVTPHASHDLALRVDTDQLMKQRIENNTVELCATLGTQSPRWLPDTEQPLAAAPGATLRCAGPRYSLRA